MLKEKPLYKQNLPTPDYLEWMNRSPQEVLEGLGDEQYNHSDDVWAIPGCARIAKSPTGEFYTVTASDGSLLKWRRCKNNDQIRRSLQNLIVRSSSGQELSIDLSDARLERLKAHAVELDMSYRTWVGKDFVIYDTGRLCGEQVLIGPNWWTTTTARYPFFHRNGKQGPSTLPLSTRLRVEDCDRVIGCDCYTDNLVVWAALSGVLDPSTKSPWLLYLGDKRQLRSQPLAWSKQLLDPSTAPNYCPMNTEEVKEQLDGQLIAAFDNVHAWSAEMFGALLSVGPNDGKRGRRDSVVQPILAGERHAQYPKDLLTRCLPIRLLRTNFCWGGDEYCSESSFQGLRGALMGSLFNVLAYSMVHRKPVVDTKFPESLHPFVSHGRAVAIAMDLSADEFDTALSESLALRESLGNPVQDENYSS